MNAALRLNVGLTMGALVRGDGFEILLLSPLEGRG